MVDKEQSGPANSLTGPYDAYSNFTVSPYLLITLWTVKEYYVVIFDIHCKGENILSCKFVQKSTCLSWFLIPSSRMSQDFVPFYTNISKDLTKLKFPVNNAEFLFNMYKCNVSILLISTCTRNTRSFNVKVGVGIRSGRKY